MDTEEIYAECLARIREKYVRCRREDAWSPITRKEFTRAFSLVPTEILSSVIDEVLIIGDLNNPSNNAFPPDPSQIVAVARKLTEAGKQTPSDVVLEIINNITAFGMYGKPMLERPSIRIEGAPPLSCAASFAVECMGGWTTLVASTQETDMGVLQGHLRRHAENALLKEAGRPILANAGNTLQIENARRMIEAEEQ